jgi:hypothetical protein
MAGAGAAEALDRARCHRRIHARAVHGRRPGGGPDSRRARVGRLGGSHHDSPNGWFGSLRWRYFGPRPLIEDNSVRSQSTSLVNARVGYAVAKQVRAYVDVFNLFDRKASDIDYFYASRLQGEPAAGVSDVPLPPRRAPRPAGDFGSDVLSGRPTWRPMRASECECTWGATAPGAVFPAATLCASRYDTMR